MRFRRLEKWDDPQGCGALVFFAQLIEELLFDYSLDTYKPSVMHTGTMCQEALLAIIEIERGNIKKPNLDHIIDELCASLEKDPVALGLLSLDKSIVYATLKDPKRDIGDKKVTLELLKGELSPSKYRKLNEELLIKELEDTQDRSLIRTLTRSYVTTLVSTGIHTRFLSEQAKDFFYFNKNRIGSPSAIRDFLSALSIDNREYQAVFRAAKIFEELKDSCQTFDITVAITPEDVTVREALIDYRLGQDEVYLIVDKIECKDVHTAREIAEKRIGFVSTLLTLFYHKENPSWVDECLVLAKDASHKKVVKKMLNPMHKCKDNRPESASRKLRLLLEGFSLERESFRKFIRSAELHSLALESDSYENQILNLWISLESLIPSEARVENESNIEHIVNSLVPFLNISYVESLLYRLATDLLNWDHKLTKSTLSNISGYKLPHKLARLLALKEFEGDFLRIEDNLRDFHLLRDRLGYFRDLLSSPKNVVGALTAHKQRLEWQIRRIYRVRNLIVHSGTTPDYTKILIEHAHDYLDAVLSTLVRLASAPSKIRSVNQGFKYIDISYKGHVAALSAKDAAFTIDNIDLLLFQAPH